MATHRALILNSDMTPLHFVSTVRAFNLLYSGRAELVSIDGPSTWGETLTSASVAFDEPATIRLLDKAPKKWFVPRFRKHALFNRDDWKCQYCGCSLTPNSATVDHVKPTAKGGDTSWRNCVTSCKKCNNYKGNRTPAEAGMKLLTKPEEPKVYHFWDIHRLGRLVFHPDWHVFFPSRR